MLQLFHSVCPGNRAVVERVNYVALHALFSELFLMIGVGRVLSQPNLNSCIHFSNFLFVLYALQEELKSVAPITDLTIQALAIFPSAVPKVPFTLQPF
jgi:hypothetical protein